MVAKTNNKHNWNLNKYTDNRLLQQGKYNYVSNYVM